LYLFGPLDVTWGDQGLPKPPTLKSQSLLAYQPISEALKSCVLHQKAADVPDWVPDWVRREVRRLFPDGVDEHGAAPTGGPGEPEQALFFEGVAAYLASLAERRGCLLVLEDLHWASASTLQMLHYLVHHLRGAPIMLAASYRPEAVGLAHSLRVLERRLAREGLAQVLDLRRLGPEAVQDLVVTMSAAGKAVLPLACRLYEETDGNPFFLMETIRALFGNSALRLERVPGAAISAGLARARSRWRQR
jgi:hypothetical protein